MPSDLRQFTKRQVERPGRKQPALDPRRATVWNRDKGCWEYFQFSEFAIEREANLHSEGSSK